MRVAVGKHEYRGGFANLCGGVLTQLLDERGVLLSEQCMNGNR